eukprot:NODE_9431_length_642_cov_143.969171_g9165_i0.p1 GENE.NODE_9431_length_642_cov_143.969171_g9165_i0~~NODE_9431_length_642_cov_143.969171_g9165_i0.p1  ORF type:complete len:137 (+),score=24.85 NODE_9431_length_642_cov_143.969171_g9165_i0:56-466(+)
MGKFIANTGRHCYEWELVKPVLSLAIQECLGNGTAEFNEDRDDIISCLDSFSGPPFTLQRLCEILVEPERYYKTKEKIAFAMAKQTSVTSTIEKMPFPFEEPATPEADIDNTATPMAADRGEDSGETKSDPMDTSA